MHEEHTIYRVETTPKWNLHPNELTAVPMGPRVAERDTSRSPSPVNDELRAEINRQKAISREMTAQGERLDKYLQSLHGSLEESKAVAEQNLILKKQLAETQNRIAQLEAKLKDLNKPAAATAQVQAQKDETKSW
jgi:predicted RNase H-like nuclease (RuvC/YqgF family)